MPRPISAVVESLTPAYVTGRRWDVLAWNAAADEIFAFGRLPEEDRNTLICADQAGHAPLFGAGWAARPGAWSQFRATHDLWAGDPAFVDPLDRLREGCPEFDGWWKAHDVRDGASGPQEMRIRLRACALRPRGSRQRRPA